MSRIKLLFTTSHLPLSWVIRAGTWSKYSHVAIVDGASIIEAAVLHGVRCVPLNEAIERAKTAATVEILTPNPQAIIDAAMSQIGKPYDYGALLGIGLHRNWQDDSKWFCSELVAWAFEQAGDPLFRREGVHRVVPQHLWMLEPNRQVAAV